MLFTLSHLDMENKRFCGEANGNTSCSMGEHLRKIIQGSCTNVINMRPRWLLFIRQCLTLLEVFYSDSFSFDPSVSLHVITKVTCVLLWCLFIHCWWWSQYSPQMTNTLTIRMCCNKLLSISFWTFSLSLYHPFYNLIWMYKAWMQWEH